MNKVLFILNVVFIISLCVIIKKCYHYKISNDFYHIEYENLLTENIELSLHNNFRKMEYSLNGEKINKTDLLINLRNEKHTIENIINENKLILYISENHCNVCIESLFSIMSEFQLINSNKIIVWVECSNTRFIHALQSKFNLPCDIIYKVSSESNSNFHKWENPFYFVLEKNTFRINSTFVPIKENDSLTKYYLNSIMTKYYE